MVFSFLIQYKWIIIFYLALVLFFVWKRKQVVSQAKIIFLYRSTFGIKFIEKFSEKCREWVKLYGLSGVGVGFLGMIVISILLIFNVIQAVISPEAPSNVSPVLPGVNVPGLGVLPFWYWLIAIFIIAVVHEFSHGIVAHAHGIKVNWTGIVLLGPIIGAFVEPDEKKLTSESDVVQYSVYAAGAFSNIVLAILVVLLMSYVSLPLQSGMVDQVGFTFDAYINTSYPAAQAGLMPGALITGINNVTSMNFSRFAEELVHYRPGDTVVVKTAEKDYSLTLAEDPTKPGRGFMGISGPRNKFEAKESYQSGFGAVLYSALEWLNRIENNGRGFLLWLYVLSFGIGLFNLLPLPIVDGGRMMQTLLRKLYGQDIGDRRYVKIGIFFLGLVVLSLLLLLKNFF